MLFLRKNFLSLVLKKKQNKNIAADHDKPTLRELNDAILTKEFSFVGVQKKNIAADHVRKPRILTMTMPQTTNAQPTVRYLSLPPSTPNDHV